MGFDVRCFRVTIVRLPRAGPKPGPDLDDGAGVQNQARSSPRLFDSFHRESGGHVRVHHTIMEVAARVSGIVALLYKDSPATANAVVAAVWSQVHHAPYWAIPLDHIDGPGAVSTVNFTIIAIHAAVIVTVAEPIAATVAIIIAITVPVTITVSISVTIPVPPVISVTPIAARVFGTRECFRRDGSEAGEC